MIKPPPHKLPNRERRDREFLYLHEIDALIAATSQTRAPIRNQALVMLLFCQALQPSEICWLRWCDLNKVANTLLIVRNRCRKCNGSGSRSISNCILTIELPKLSFNKAFRRL